MIEQILLNESEPYPNSKLPVILYPKGLVKVVDGKQSSGQVMEVLAGNNYLNGWVNGIFGYHHFHSNTHEVLVCLEGEATVQLGGPDGKKVTFAQGDVLLLPAGTAHKRLKSTKDFSIVGAYPGGQSFNTYKSEDVQSEEDFKRIKKEISEVAVPQEDPVQGQNGAVQTYWK